MVETDETDEAIIRLLQEDGRMSNREIARQLSVSEGTVRQRLKRLVETGAIRLGVVTDPVKLGLTSVSYVRLRVAPRSRRAVIDALEAMEDVFFVASILGEFDVVAVPGTRTRQHLRELVNERIARLAGVLSVEVREIAATLKHRYDIVRIK
jgi:Lrp/AsnC family transcriptional regulator for asnA, asnC and gidA